MNEHLRQRIQRKLEALPDDRGYQILDYIEFLETKYAERAAPSANPFTKFTDAVEDRLRAGKVSASAIAETVGLMNKAAGVLNNAMQATRTMATELASVPEAVRQAAQTASQTAPASASQPAPQTPAAQPGSGGTGSGAPSSGPSGPASAQSPSTAAPPPRPSTTEASSTAHETRQPGSGEEIL